MYNRILIANRGEIALRIIRACREMGIESVVIFSEADRGSAYLELADEAICVGPARSADSYLKIRNGDYSSFPVHPLKGSSLRLSSTACWITMLPDRLYGFTSLPRL